MKRQRSASEIDEFVGVLLEATGQLSEIADHMVRVQEAGLSAGDAMPPAEVLRKLLTDTLSATRPGFAKAEVRKATGILRRTTNTVATEIYLVPIDQMEEGAMEPDDLL